MSNAACSRPRGELTARGHQVNLIYAKGGDLVPGFKQMCASVHHARYTDYSFPESRGRAWMEHVRLLPAVAWAATCRPDVYYMNRTFAAEWALQAAKLSPAPVVCHWRGTQTPGPRYVASLSAKVSRFVANSAFTRDVWLAAGIDPDKVDVVHAGLDAAEYPEGGAAQRESARVELGIPDDVFVAVFVGRLDAEKGVEVLLEAWRRLAVTPAEALLLLVGSPVLHSDGQAYLDQLKALAPAGTVRFLGARRRRGHAPARRRRRRGALHLGRALRPHRDRGYGHRPSGGRLPGRRHPRDAERPFRPVPVRAGRLRRPGHPAVGAAGLAATRPGPGRPVRGPRP